VAAGTGGVKGIWGQLGDWFTSSSTWQGPGGLPHQTLQHLYITVVAVGIAAVVALPLGVWLGHHGRGGSMVTVIANATRAVPTYGLMVLLAGIATIGIGNRAAVVALVVFAVAPLLTNANAGIRDVDPDAVEAARGLGMSGRQILRRVEIPLALPLLAAGVRTSAVQTCATATLAAFVGGTGLGAPIFLGYGEGPNGKGPLVGGAIAVAVITLLVELVLAFTQAVLTPGTRARGVVRRFPAPASAAGAAVEA
jgi:osmoprotectant transport system permease protein